MKVRNEQGTLWKTEVIENPVFGVSNEQTSNSTDLEGAVDCRIPIAV